VQNVFCKKKKKTPILPKNSLKLISSKFLSFWLTTNLLYLLEVFFNRQSAYLWTDVFLYSYEAEFIQELLKKNEKKLARYFNFTFRYIDDDLSLTFYAWLFRW